MCSLVCNYECDNCPIKGFNTGLTLIEEWEDELKMYKRCSKRLLIKFLKTKNPRFRYECLKRYRILKSSIRILSRNIKEFKHIA